MALLEVASLVLGLAVMVFASDKAVNYATRIAKELGVPSVIIGLVLVSFGTDIAEIANSIFSSFIQHGDINAGDTMGSSLSQITLVLGLVAIISSKQLKAHRRDILILGGSTVLALASSAFALSDSFLSRLDAVLLILAYCTLLILSSRVLIKRRKSPDTDEKRPFPVAVILFLVSMVFVAIGAITVVNSIIVLSEELNLPEFIVSFFTIGIGTSLPELTVQINAAKKGRYGLIMGDAFGSTLTDSTLALASGPLLFPTSVSGDMIGPLVGYAIVAAILVTCLLYFRRKIDRKAAVFLIVIYLISFLVGTM